MTASPASCTGIGAAQAGGWADWAGLLDSAGDVLTAEGVALALAADELNGAVSLAA